MVGDGRRDRHVDAHHAHLDLLGELPRTGAEGQRSEGLRIKALPQAMAGASIHSGIMAGKLNGVTPATTPKGWRSE